tara:strand:+ start:260 stop:688 length:429 start_codon:yes stop_codon:yes gene_type:complete
MTETEIFTSLNNTLMATGLFAITWAFLVWVAGRAVTIAVENNAGIITKIVTTIFGLSALWQFNFAFAYVPWSFATAAHSLAVLKSSGTDLTLSGESFLNAFPGEVSESAAPVFTIIPNDPFYTLFILSALYLVVGRLWIGNK